MRARKENLRAPRLTAHIVDVGADAIAIAEALARDHLIAAHNTFGAPKIDHHRTEFHALDRAVHDFTDAVLVFVILPLAFGIAHFLHDHLFGGLRCDTREFDRRQGLGYDVANLGRWIAPPRIDQRHLDLVIVD